MKTFLPLMLAAVSLVARTSPQTAAQTPSKGRQIIDQTVQALGGDAFLR